MANQGQIHPLQRQFVHFYPYTQAVYPQTRPQAFRVTNSWNCIREKQQVTSECILGNNDTDFLDDRKLVLLAIELGATSKKDLPDLRILIKDLV